MKNYKLGKLGGRTLLAIAGVVPPIVLGIGFASYSAIKIIHQDAEEIISLETEKLEGSVSQWVTSNTLALQNMAELPDMVSLDPQRQEPILENILTHYDNLYLAHSGDLNGDNIARSDGKALRNYSDRQWFKGAIAGNNYTQQTLIGKTSGKPALCTAAPVRREAAIVGTVTTCSSLDAIAQEVSNIDLGETGIAIVVNDRGEVIAHSNSKYTSGDTLADFSNYPPVAGILAGSEGHFIFTDEEGIEWVAYGKLLDNGWAAFTLQHTNEAFAAENRFRLIAIASIVFVILATTILVRESVSSVEKQAVKQRQEKEQLEKAIYTLIEEVSDATDGDLTVRANLDSEELSTVADLFNAIIDNLEEMAIEARDSTGLVGSSLQQNESAIRLLAEQAIAEAKETRDTLLSVEQMSQSIQAVAENASQAEKITNDTYNTVVNSTDNMDLTVQSIANLRTTVGETAKKIKRLGESSQKISQVVSFIEEIALKTNVLAINASVEAGRAGEYGQGFTIVAEQVGALAEQSAAATKEIANIVAVIQSETQEVNQAMESGTAQVVETTQIVESTKQSLEVVLKKSQEINQLMESISQSTVSQANTSQNVTQLMQKIAELSANTSKSSTEVAQSIGQTAEVAKKLESTVAQFKVTE